MYGISSSLTLGVFDPGSPCVWNLSLSYCPAGNLRLNSEEACRALTALARAGHSLRHLADHWSPSSGSVRRGNGNQPPTDQRDFELHINLSNLREKIRACKL